MSSSQEFGAVFKAPSRGGPSWAPVKNPYYGKSLPSWSDWRTPGNTNANESAKSIMQKWDRYKMRRFEIFMEQFYINKTPWRLEWLGKTAPGWKDNEKKIVKCKLELIKRILRIKVTGPESLEDWILLFLYTENELSLPMNLAQLLNPNSAVTGNEAFLYLDSQAMILPEMFVYPAPYNVDNPGNMYLPGFDTLGQTLGPSDYQRPRIGAVNTRGTNLNLAADHMAEIRQRAARFPRESRNAFSETPREFISGMINLHGNPLNQKRKI